jgi:hypothetical protein
MSMFRSDESVQFHGEPRRAACIPPLTIRNECRPERSEGPCPGGGIPFIAALSSQHRLLLRC